MSNIKPIRDKPGFMAKLSQILILIGVTLISMMVFSLIGVLIGSQIYGIPFSELRNFQEIELTNEVVNALKIFQVFSALGSFLVPALLVPYLIGEKPLRFLSLRKTTTPFVYLLVIALLFFLFPFIEWLIQLNEGLTFPTSLKFIEEWMQAQENQTGRLIEAFMKMDSRVDLLINIIVIALLAAIAEELFFRGLMQRMFYQWYRNVHVSIILTAVIFSAFHMQFYGFLPRMFLGLVFGYLLYFTGSIWAPVFAHFINNGTGVLVAYLQQRNWVNQEIENQMDLPTLTIIISLLLGALIMFYLSRINRRNESDKNEENKDWAKIYSTMHRQKAEIVKGVLENEGIPAVIMDKLDSSYQAFGELEVYVTPDNLEEAERLILNRNL